jgi:hypothetical protein
LDDSVDGGRRSLACLADMRFIFPNCFRTACGARVQASVPTPARLVAAAGPFTLGALTSRMFSNEAQPMRYAGVAMCLVFAVGLTGLSFAPETRASRCRNKYEIITKPRSFSHAVLRA